MMMKTTLTNRRWRVLPILLCAAGAALGTTILSGSASGQNSNDSAAMAQPFAQAGFAAFQRASTTSDALPSNVRREIEDAAAHSSALDGSALDFAGSRRLASDVAGTSTQVYLIPGRTPAAPACMVQMIGAGYTYGCGPQATLVDQSTVHAGLVSMERGVWRYWGVATRRVRNIDLVLESGVKLFVPIVGDVFGIDTSERPKSLEWTDASGAVHTGTLALPPSPG